MNNINFSLLFKVNLALSSVLFLCFLTLNAEYTVVGFILTIIGSISSVMILYIIYYLISLPFLWTNKLIVYVMTIIFILTNVMLIVDFFIFKLFSFHLNAMVLNIILSPDAFDSIQVGIFPILLFVFSVLLIIIFEFILIKKLYKQTNSNKIKLNQKLNKFITVPLIIIVLSDKSIYGFANLFSKNDLLHSFKVIPLYQPLTFRRIASKHFGFKAEKQAQYSINKTSKMNYPLEKIKINNKIKPFNIFLIASDSVKYSIMNDNTTPNINEFSKDALVFNNHYSGGNSTRFGIFSLMYGLNSTYWFSFLNANQKPILFDVLKQLNYNIKIISSTNTNWPEFRKTCYVDIQDSISDKFKGVPWKKDEQSSNEYINNIENINNNIPSFSFLFLDAPHGYSYPKDMNKFDSESISINYLNVGKNTNELKNTIKNYKNAVFYNDTLFGKIIKKLKDKNLYDNSMIIFTSDHGQEFYEFGKFGHNTSFSNGQIKVPLIVKLPNNLKVKYLNNNDLTSHQDIVPSILSLLGVKNKTNTYSNGQNIFSNEYEREYIFSSNWNNNSIVTKDKTYVFSNMPNKMFNNEVRSTNTYELIKNEKVNSKFILDIINENRRFLK